MTAEACNPELDALLFRDFDDARTWSVYADWWLERGEPRGELVRLELAAQRDSQAERTLLDANWARWFGPLQRYPLSGLEKGFARKLEVPQSPEVAVWARLPGLKFLQAVTVPAGFEGSLSGLGMLAGLKAVELLEPTPEVASQLRAEPLAALESARVVRTGRFDAADVAPLLSLNAPRLAELGFTAYEARLGHVLTALLAWPGLRGLRALTLKGLSLSDTERLLEQRARFAHLRLSLSADGPTLSALRPRLREAFPTAWLAPNVEPSTSDRSVTVGAVTAAPTRAPADFRSLAPRVEVKSRYDEYGDHSVWHGSGEPPSSYDLIRRCLRCASLDVVCIWSEDARTHSSQEQETYVDRGRELSCRECGAFFWYRTFETRG